MWQHQQSLVTTRTVSAKMKNICDKPNHKPTMWRWFIPTIRGNVGWLGFPCWNWRFLRSENATDFLCNRWLVPSFEYHTTNEPQCASTPKCNHVTMVSGGCLILGEGIYSDTYKIYTIDTGGFSNHKIYSSRVGILSPSPSPKNSTEAEGEQVAQLFPPQAFRIAWLIWMHKCMGSMFRSSKNAPKLCRLLNNNLSQLGFWTHLLNPAVACCRAHVRNLSTSCCMKPSKSLGSLDSFKWTPW